MPALKYIVYGCFSLRTTPEVITLHFTLDAEMVQDRVRDDNLNNQIKNQTLHTCRLFLLTQIFNISAIGQEYFSIYPPSFFNNNKHRLIISPNFPRFFSLLCRFIYKLGEHFFIYNSWYTFNFETTYKNHPSSR